MESLSNSNNLFNSINANNFIHNLLTESFILASIPETYGLISSLREGDVIIGDKPLSIVKTFLYQKLQI